MLRERRVLFEMRLVGTALSDSVGIRRDHENVHKEMLLYYIIINMRSPVQAAAELIDHAAGFVMNRAVLGIDIGTSSIRIVQLKTGTEKPVLETYGAIELGPYADMEKGETVKIDAHKNATALLDLLHEVKASARVGGMSIPLSSTFIALIDSPSRNDEQMRRLIPTEAAPYIPAPLDSVTLDWQVIPEPENESAFAYAEKKEAVSPHMQKLLLAAVRNEALLGCQKITANADLSISFYEVEMFGAARSNTHRAGESGLLIDLGASTSKIYVLDEHGMTLGAHTAEYGGSSITKHLMETFKWHFDDAEKAKRSEGLSNIRKQLGHAISEIMSKICDEAHRTVHAYNTDHARKISYAVLMGGGARMPGIAEYTARQLGLDISIATPFEHVRGPMILEDVLRDVGPLYAVATGLALRGLHRNRH